MDKNKFFKVGITGAVVTAICCVTPVLVILFGAFGIGAMVAYLDMILFPLLAVFLGMAGYGYWKRKQI
ncbi:mercury resistance system transport protein MerF [Kiloniella antarctica]|uniref:Mercury resistance system transport protein MerF n=1 Tax=Kiloniella antarctica TaxID=1550907 RepID=A0ABW5BKJ9_9PROT